VLSQDLEEAEERARSSEPQHHRRLVSRRWRPLGRLGIDQIGRCGLDLRKLKPCHLPAGALQSTDNCQYHKLDGPIQPRNETATGGALWEQPVQPFVGITLGDESRELRGDARNESKQRTTPLVLQHCFIALG